MLDNRREFCAILSRSACEVKRTAKQFAASGVPKLEKPLGQISLFENRV